MLRLRVLEDKINDKGSILVYKDIDKSEYIYMNKKDWDKYVNSENVMHIKEMSKFTMNKFIINKDPRVDHLLTMELEIDDYRLENIVKVIFHENSNVDNTRAALGVLISEPDIVSTYIDRYLNEVPIEEDGKIITAEEKTWKAKIELKLEDIAREKYEVEQENLKLKMALVQLKEYIDKLRENDIKQEIKESKADIVSNEFYIKEDLRGVLPYIVNGKEVNRVRIRLEDRYQVYIEEKYYKDIEKLFTEDLSVLQIVEFICNKMPYILPMISKFYKDNDGRENK